MPTNLYPQMSLCGAKWLGHLCQIACILIYSSNFFEHRIHHLFSSVPVLTCILEDSGCKRKEFCQAWTVCTHTFPQASGWAIGEPSKGAPGKGEGPSLEGCPGTTQSHIYLACVSTWSVLFLFFSGSNSNCHFLFRIGWTLLRK